MLCAARNRMFSELLESRVSSLSLKSIIENKEYDATKVIISFLLHNGLYLRILSMRQSSSDELRRAVIRI